MSRHRSPSGRRADPRSSAAAGTPRPATTPAVRHGLAAAAMAGGALAVGAPGIALLTEGYDARASEGGTETVVRLAADSPDVRDALDALRPAAVPVAGPSLLATIEPVAGVGVSPPADDGAPDARIAEVADLLKAAGLADIVRKAQEERAAREAATRCGTDLDALGRVKPWVAQGAEFLSCLHGEPDLIGVAGRGRVSDHPSGHAVDFMMRGERGDRLAACALRNREALGIEYVIWEQRINHGDGWERMADRGGDTENHVDHVHVSFERRAPGGTPDPTVCG